MSASTGQIGERFKKWAITIAAVLALIGFGSTTHFWVPWLLKFAHANKDAADEIKKLLDLVGMLVGWASAAAVFLLRLWKEKKEQKQQATTITEQAGRDIIHAGGNVQSGGFNLSSQGPVTVDGDAVGHDKIQTKIEIHLPQPLPQPPSVELVSKPRVVDAALPNHVVKDVATELLVLIRLPDSPGLRGILQGEEDVEARPEDVRSRPFEVAFPLGRSGKLDPLKVAVKLTSPDFSPPEQVKNIFVPPDSDSDVVPFLLTPLYVGPLTVLVELLWEDALHGHRHLTTKCVAEATEIPAQSELNLVQMSVAVGVGSISEPAPALKNLPAPSIRIDLPGGPHGASASEAPAAPVLPSPPEHRKGPRESIHKKLKRVRPPRTYAEYDVTDSEPSQVSTASEGIVISGGDVTVAGDVIGRDKIEIHQASPLVLSSLHQLPAPPPDFQGRTRELAELRATMTTEKSAIAAVQGQGGIGKTSLALKLAEVLSSDYPDAQIYLDLRGVSDNPVPAPEALAHVIHSFRPEAKLPERQLELEALYRSVLHDKRALLLLDNVRDAAQVAPLHPPQGSALLVTSRQHFTLPGLSAKNAKNLTALLPPDAEALLLKIAPPMDGGHSRTICKLCGFLPQALRLAAGALANRRDLSPVEYVRQLGDEKKRLQLLKEDEDGGQSVEASIGLSYRLLDGPIQKRWRTLAIFPDTFDLPAAAAVWDTERGSAQDTLGTLLRHSMLEWNETSARYRLHDLMRDFARARLNSAEIDESALHHAKHYLQTLERANALYMQGGDAANGALVLFDIEWDNIRAAQAWAANHATSSVEAAQLSSDYPDRGAFLLVLRQDPREQVRWRELALSAARQLRNRRSEGVHLGNLGLAYHSLGEYRRAIEYHNQHLAIAREIGDRRGEGNALGSLGVSNFSLGEYRLAIEYHKQQLAIAREIGDRRGEGNSLGSLGLAHHSLGEYRRAIEYQQEHLVIAREIGNLFGEGSALGNLGLAYHSLGEYRRAIEYHEQHLAIARKIGDRRGEGNALGNLGNAYHSLGEYRRAIEYHEQDLAIAREIGNLLGVGNALGNLGNAYYSLGEYGHAIEYHEQNLVIARLIGDRRGEGHALGNLGNAFNSLGEYRRAIEYHEQQLAVAREIGDRRDVGNALGSLGLTYLSLGEYRRSINYHYECLVIFREVGDRCGEGTALWNTSLALRELGEHQKAIDYTKDALQIYEQIESPYAEEVRKQLQRWQGPTGTPNP